MTSPIRLLQSRGDDLKREVDGVEETVDCLIRDKVGGDEMQKAYRDCINLKLKSSVLLAEAHALLEVNEKTRVPIFQTKKNEEMQRVQKLQSRLNTLMDEVESSCSDVEHLRSLRYEEETENIPNTPTKNESMEEDVDDDGDNINNNESKFSSDVDDYEDEEGDYYEVIQAFNAEEDDDLTIESGDIVCVLEKQDDGWWKVRDEKDNIGMVPSNFLQQWEEDLEETEIPLKEDTGESVTDIGSEPHTGTALSFKERSGKELWKGIKDAVKEPVKTDVTDVLTALGAIPAGFRPSTLSKFSAKEEYTLKNAVLPSFTASNTGLSDLQWDSALNQVKAIPTRILRSCRLWSCKMIPLAGSGVEVLSRHVRLALFDGTNVLSNVQTVRATWSPNSPKLWTFSPRSSGILSSILDGACVIRSDKTHSNLGILFELCVTYIRAPPKKIVHYSDGPEVKYSDSDEEEARAKLAATGERSELSCGWVFLKLFDEQGVAIPNKTYELAVHGGTPFEKGVAVDPSIARRASNSRLRNFLQANKQPKIVFKMGTPDHIRKKIMNLLPLNIVLPSTYCLAISMYRRVLADALIRDRLSLRDADPIASPFLSTFPIAVMLPDIMDALRVAWADKVKTFRRADKRDKESLKSNFKQVFLETAYILVRSMPLPTFQWAHQQSEQGRWQKIYQHLQLSKSATSTGSGVKIDSTNAVLKSLLSSNVDHMPFDMSELSFSLVKDYKKAFHAGQ